MSLAAELSRKPWSWAAPWLGGLVAASAFCAGYFMMPVYRKKWQVHFPALASQWANNGRFAVIGWYGTELANEELAYASRVVEASRAFPAFDPYIKENRTYRQFVIDALTYLLMGLIHKVMGDINTTWIVIRFLACALWFVLVYFITLRLGRSPPFALFCATTVSLFSYLMLLYFIYHLEPSSPFKLAWTILSYGRTEGVLRLPRPGLTYTFLFLATLVSIKTAEKNGWGWPVLLGVLTGLMAYIRFDVWTAQCLALFLFMAGRSWQGRRLDRRLFLSCAIGALLSLPYVLLLYPADPDLLVRASLHPRREFDPFSLPYLAAWILAWRGRKAPAELFLGAMCGANFFMVNIELLLGHPIQPEHWKYFANIYVFFVLMAFIPERWKKVEAAWLTASAAMVAIAAMQGLAYAAIHFPFQGLPRHYEEALDWIKANIPADSEFYTANPEVAALLPVYAHQKLVAGYPMPVVSTFSMLGNMRRFVAGANAIGLDVVRYMNETAFKHPHMNDRRGVVATGLYRGQIEKHDAYTYFCSAPLSVARETVAQALKDPAPILPDYVWFGHLEREYTRKDSPLFTSKDWRELYRNPMVTIYARNRPSPPN